MLKRIADNLRNKVGELTLEWRIAALERKTGIPGLRDAFHRAHDGGEVLAQDTGPENEKLTLTAYSWFRPAGEHVDGWRLGSSDLNSYVLELDLTAESPSGTMPVANVVFHSSAAAAFRQAMFGRMVVDDKPVLPECRNEKIAAFYNYVRSIS